MSRLKQNIKNALPWIVLLVIVSMFILMVNYLVLGAYELAGILDL